MTKEILRARSKASEATHRMKLNLDYVEDCRQKMNDAIQKNDSLFKDIMSARSDLAQLVDAEIQKLRDIKTGVAYEL